MDSKILLWRSRRFCGNKDINLDFEISFANTARLPRLRVGVFFSHGIICLVARNLVLSRNTSVCCGKLFSLCSSLVA